MCRADEVVIVKRFKPPDAACDPKTYLAYVNSVLALDCTVDECADLCRRYQCGVKDLADRIVNEKMAKKPGKGR